MLSENSEDIFSYTQNFDLDIGIQIQLKVEGIAYPLQSYVVGMEHSDYLIIKAPKSFTSIKFKLVPGAEIIVRYLYHGTVYGFQTKLIEIIQSPFRLLFLQYPKIIEHHELRHHRRVESYLPAKMQINDHPELSSTIIDVSENGCRCLIKTNQDTPSIHIDDQASILCQFPGIDGSHLVVGSVKNISRSRRELYLGIEFIAVESRIHELIANYVFT